MQKKKNDIKKSLFNYLDGIEKASQISGWELFDAMLAKTGLHTYPSTLLHYVRDYADITGADFECLDNQKSIYLFTPSAFKIGNLKIIEGKE